jgi:hypothetical protein
VDQHGALVPLEEQDRGRWDESRIQEGLTHLSRAGRGDALTEHHLLAGIAACHATAESVEATEWGRVVQLYDELAARGAGDVVQLNRVVAVSYRDGPVPALALLEELARSPALARYPLLPAVRADLLRRAGRHAEAAAQYREAAALAANAPERLYYERRAAEADERRGEGLLVWRERRRGGSRASDSPRCGRLEAAIGRGGAEAPRPSEGTDARARRPPRNKATTPGKRLRLTTPAPRDGRATSR